MRKTTFGALPLGARFMWDKSFDTRVLRKVPFVAKDGEWYDPLKEDLYSQKDVIALDEVPSGSDIHTLFMTMLEIANIHPECSACEEIVLMARKAVDEFQKRDTP